MGKLVIYLLIFVLFFVGGYFLFKNFDKLKLPSRITKTEKLKYSLSDKKEVQMVTSEGGQVSLSDGKKEIAGIDFPAIFFFFPGPVMFLEPVVNLVKGMHEVLLRRFYGQFIEPSDCFFLDCRA